MPEVEITDEQKDAIKDLVANNEHFLTIYKAVPFLVPIKAKENDNNLDDTCDAFIDDQRMLSNWPNHHANLDNVNWSVNAAVDRVNEAVAPVVEAMIGDDLKKQLPEDLPESIKDKAVGAACDKATEKGTEAVIKDLVNKQLKGQPLGDEKYESE